MRTLTQDQARSIILRRHGLLEPFLRPLDAMRAVFAVQTQYAASLPMALAVRTKGMKAGWHRKDEHRDIVKAWTLRSTLHAHAAEDHDLFLAAVGRQMFERYAYWINRNRGIDRATLDRMQNGILEALANGPLTRPEIHERVPEWKSVESTGWGIDVMGLAYLGQLKLLVADGGATRFALHASSVDMEPGEATAELMRRYFASYGPATLADFLYWSGMKATPTAPIFASLRDELTEIKVDGLKGARWMLGSEASDDLPKVKLLAKFDPLTMGHRDKSLFLDEKHRSFVIRKAGQVEAVVLVNGRMSGTWRLVRKGSRSEIVVEPFRKIAQARWPGIQREAKRVAAALGLKEVEVRSTEG